MSAFQISFGNNDELDEVMKKAAEKAVKEAIEAEKPIRPVVQQVIQKTVEHVVEGNAKDLVDLHKVKMLEGWSTTAQVLAVIIGIAGACKLMFSYK